MRTDGRTHAQLRKIVMTPNYTAYAEGSVLIEYGNTRVLCTATIEDGLPKWLKGEGQGWITAEYGMLPRSTHTRMGREKILNGGRTAEISRLIGRSLRGAIDLKLVGERQIMIDCDVIQADGGTRTAAVTGGFVSMCLAVQKALKAGVIKINPVKNYLAAVSVGVHKGHALLDLNYEEDSTVEIDMNFVVNSKNEFVEVQGTAERGSFNHAQLMEMVALAQKGCTEIFQAQSSILKDFLPL